jgi:hypothetical protein
MRAGDDLESYAVARGAVLREVLLRLDCPAFLVDGVVTEALGRCRRGWSRTLREGDADVVVLESLLVTWFERRRATGWEDRAGAVLAEVTELDPWQITDVVGGLARRRRRGPAVRAMVIAAVLVLIGGGAAALWPGAAQESEPGGLEPAPVQVEEPVVDAVFAAGGVLRLRDAALTVGSVGALVTIGQGAAYRDGDGSVVRVGADGERTLLGTADPGSPLVAGSDGRLLSWVDDTGGAVLFDVVAGEQVGRLPGPGVVPVAIDGDTLYVNDAGGSSRYVAGGEPTRLSGLPLLDAQAGSLLFQVGDRIRLEGPGGRPSYVGLGTGGALSPDGRFALVGSASGRPVAYDLLGGSVTTGIRPGERALAATPVRDGQVVAVVAVPERAADDEEFSRSSASGSWELRTCTLGTGECEVDAILSAAGAVPVFAR